MSERTQRIQKIRDLAAYKEDKFAAALGARIKASQDQKDQLAVLQRYRAEYCAEMAHAGGGKIDGAKLKNLDYFIRQLDISIARQEARIRTAEFAVSLARQEWSIAHTRTSALEKVTENLSEQDRIQADKREQKEQDDRVGRKGIVD